MVIEGGNPGTKSGLQAIRAFEFTHFMLPFGLGQVGDVMRISSVLVLVILSGTGASAQGLDVPVVESAGDGEAATCGVSEVRGLKAGGDGFLAIRSGPGSKYRKLGELVNGDQVTSVAKKGEWVGIVTENARINHANLCSNDGPARSIKGSGVGWVHGGWLTYLYP